MNSASKFAATLIVAAGVLFAGCSRQQGAGVEPEDAATPQAVAREAAVAVRDRAVRHEQGLPPGVTLPFRHSVRVDRVIRREGRDDVRRIDLEYFDGDQETVYAQAIEAVEAAGFELHNQSVTGNGYFRSSFRKSGYGPLILIVTPDMDAVTARDPGAIGRVVFDLPPPD